MTTIFERRQRRRRSPDEVATAHGWRGVVETMGEGGVFYILCLMLIFAPLALGAVRPWSRGPLHLATILALLCWAARWFVAAKASWIRTPLDLPIVIGTLYVVARYAFSPVEWESRQEMLLVVMYATVYFLATQHLFRRRRQNAVFWLWIVLAACIAAYGIYNWSRGIQMTWWLPNPYYPGRAGGTFYCPNHFAGYLEIILALAVANLFWSGRSAAQRIVITYAALVMLGGIAVSLSRGAYLSAGGMLLFVLLAVSRGVSKRWWPGFLLITLIAACGVAGVMSYEPIQKRFSDMQPHAGEPSRQWMWQAAVKMAMDYPWFGVGPFLFNARYGPYRLPEDQAKPEHAHNDYLQTLADYGSVGFVLMGILVVTFLVSAWRIHRRWQQRRQPGEPRWQWPIWLELDHGNRPAWLLGSVGAVLSYMSHSVVDFNLHITSNALTLTVIIAVAMLADYTRHLSNETYPELITLPSVARAVELTMRARWMAASALVVLAIAMGLVAVPNFAAALLQLRAEKQSAALEIAEARATLQIASRIDPNNIYVLRLLGDLTLSEARHASKNADALAEEALRLQKRASGLNPFSAQLSARCGDVLEFLGRWDEAEAAFRRATELDPNFAYFHQHLGNFWFYRGKKDLAAAEFRRALELDPDDRFSRKKLDAINAAPRPAPAIKP